jgi:DNA-binding CsgD family transcriptional regulator
LLQEELNEREKMITVVNEEIKERIKALMTKGLSAEKISEIIQLKRSTIAYHMTRIRKNGNGNGNGKKKLAIDSLAHQEKSLSETFFGETITGFFMYNDILYCVMESGIALSMKEASSVSKENVNNIKNKMRYELEQMQRRMELFNEMDKIKT